MRAWFQAALALAFAIAGSAAFAQNATVDVQHCMKRTGAPGAYAVSTGSDVPQVVPSTRGTQQGAILVNDCLLDRYQVQFAAVDHGAEVEAAVVTDADQCLRVRNRRLIVGTLLTVGTVAALGGGDAAIVGGVAGTAAGVRGVNKRYRDCLNTAETQRSTGTGLVFIDDCGRGSNVVQGGSAYCRD